MEVVIYRPRINMRIEKNRFKRHADYCHHY